MDGKLGVSGAGGELNNVSFDQLELGGTSASLSDYPWNGVLDDIRIYSRALSAAEVQALYELEKPKVQ